MGKFKYLVLHCTATPEGREVTADEIRRWHTSAPPVGRGWKQVGYTDMIHLDGRVERLVDNNEDAQVDSWEITNGAKGYNTTARHVVYVGGVAADGKTPVSWNFTTMPSEEWKNMLGSALALYAADQTDANWDGVVSAFVDNWASEYAMLGA